MTGSKLGENIRQQILAYEDKAQNELGAEGQALQNQIQAAGAKKSPALQAKETAFRQKVTERQSLIQGGEMAARKRYLAELGAIVHAVMTERGADVVLEKSNVADSVNGLDITRDVIQRLDKKIPSFKVPLVKPPLSEMLQMQQMQQMQQRFLDALKSGWQEGRIDPDVIRKHMEERRQAIARILAYLDQWPHVPEERHGA